MDTADTKMSPPTVSKKGAQTRIRETGCAAAISGQQSQGT